MVIAGMIGIVNYAVCYKHPEVAFVAAGVSILVGLFWHASPERLATSLLQSGICMAMYGFVLPVTLKFMLREHVWWHILPLSIFHGVLGGAALGAISGGICRQLSERKTNPTCYGKP